jgi:hypothetical protein
MVPEPQYRNSTLQHNGSAYNGRWMWWYSAIADELIANPDLSVAEIAKKLNRHPNTIGQIMKSDMFVEYYSRRKQAFHALHDHRIRSRMTDVATEGLDAILTTLKQKKDQIPLRQLESITTSVLDRLGYGTQTAAPSVVVNQTVDNRQQSVVLPSGVTASDLEEARMALRQAEARRAGSATLSHPAVIDATSLPLADLEAGLGSDGSSSEAEVLEAVPVGSEGS